MTMASVTSEAVHDLEPNRRTELADIIDRQSDAIVARWLERVRLDASAARVPTTELVDGLKFYLKRLVSLLRGDQSLVDAGASAWADVAQEHAITRVRLGFNVSQLFHELVVLRRVMMEALWETTRCDEVLVEAVTELVEVAIAASLKSYVDSRDFAMHRVEAEHIGFLTHELKNPLGAASLAASQLRADQLSTEQQHLCDVMERSLGRLRRLVDDALLATRLEAAEVEPSPSDLTLEQLVSDAVAFFRRTAQQKGLRFDARYDPALTVRVDPQLTMSATENLLDNAIKYTDHGVVTLEIEDKLEALAFHVRDQCGGLSAEELRVIFEPFKRAHTSKPGTGLGLSIARRSIEAQGGTIHAESSSQTGCHFWFELPKRAH
jgi:hypothetical protein